MGDFINKIDTMWISMASEYILSNPQKMQNIYILVVYHCFEDFLRTNPHLFEGCYTFAFLRDLLR